MVQESGPVLKYFDAGWRHLQIKHPHEDAVRKVQSRVAYQPFAQQDPDFFFQHNPTSLAPPQLLALDIHQQNYEA